VSFEITSDQNVKELMHALIPLTRCMLDEGELKLNLKCN